MVDPNEDSGSKTCRFGGISRWSGFGIPGPSRDNDLVQPQANEPGNAGRYILVGQRLEKWGKEIRAAQSRCWKCRLRRSAC